MIKSVLSADDRDRIKANYAVDGDVATALESGKFVRKYTNNKALSIDEENHEIEFVASTAEVDRDGERILPKAYQNTMKYYLDNPVVLFGHDHKIPAVGKMIDHRITDEEMVVRDKFAVDEHPFAKLLFDLYAGEYMRMVSVGFIPLEWTDDDDMKLPGQRKMTYVEVELIEHSLVNVGSNRSALAKGEGLTPEVLERAYTELPTIKKDSAISDAFDFLAAYVEAAQKEEPLSEEHYTKAQNWKAMVAKQEPKGKEGLPGITEQEAVFLHKDEAGKVLGIGTKDEIYPLIGNQTDDDKQKPENKQSEAVSAATSKMPGMISGTYEHTLRKIWNSLAAYLSDETDSMVWRGDYMILGTTDTSVIFHMVYPDDRTCKVDYSIMGNTVEYSNMMDVEIPLDSITEIEPAESGEEGGVQKTEDELSEADKERATRVQAAADAAQAAQAALDSLLDD